MVSKQTLLLLAVVVLGGGLGVYFSRTTPSEPRAVNQSVASSPASSANASAQAITPTPTPSRSPITLNFVGDIMLDRSVLTKIRANGAEYPYRKLGSLFEGADKVIANLEGPVTDLGTHAVANGPLLFTFEPAHMAALVKAGIDAVSLANNHTHNQGAKGLTDTRSNVREAGLAVFGDPREVGDDTVYRTEVQGWKLAFVGWNMIEVSDTHETELLDLIKKLDNEVDQVIIMPHWGVEYKPQTAEQIRTAHAMIDAGADLIVGAHPHTVQGAEVYKDTPIVYSLGNFIFDQYWSEPTQQGLMVKVLFDGDKKTVNFVPIDLHQSQPREATGRVAEQVVERLLDASDLTDEQVSYIKTNQKLTVNFPTVTNP